MPRYDPDYIVMLYRPSAFGAAQVVSSWTMDTLLRADISLPVSDGVGQASLVFADPGNRYLNTIKPQQMDIVRIWCNSRLITTPVVAWTGFVNDAISHWDNQQYGQTLVLQCTTPYLLWENTSFVISSTTNDAATLAMSYVGGIGARDLIKYTAHKVSYPGTLGVLPTPAGLHLYGTDPKTGKYTQPEYVGQRNYSIPDNVFTDPQLQNYGAVLQSLTADTGMVLYCDAFGSLVFEPLPYMNMPSNPRILDNIEIVDLVLDSSEQGIITEVRVAYQNTYSFQSYSIGNAPAALEATIGKRVLTLQAPWINSKASADFLAQELIRQYASGVAKGQVTILADPGCSPGSVIGVPSPDSTGGVAYYGITNAIDSWQWGGPWLRTLQLGYGRDIRQSYPLVGIIQAPVFNTEAQSGIPGDTSNYVNPLANQLTTGAQGSVWTLTSNSTISAQGCWAPYPVGSIIQVRDTNGKPLPGASTGEYKVVAQPQPSSLTITLNSNGGVTSGVVTVISIAQQDNSTAAPTPTGSPITGTKLSPGGSGYAGAAVSTATKTLGVAPANLAQAALGAALTLAGQPYGLGHQGENTPASWDCSGLVYWAYTVAQYGWPRMIAGAQYQYLLAHGAPEIQLVNAVVGDLLFFGDMTDAGNQHIGFLHTIVPAGGGQVTATLFSAMNYTDGIGDCPVASFRTEGGLGLSHVLSMQAFTIKS